MSLPLETFLARIYVDAEARQRFLKDPRHEAETAGLGPTECDAVCRIDRTGLELASASFAHKRHNARRRSLRTRMRRWVRECLFRS